MGPNKAGWRNSTPCSGASSATVRWEHRETRTGERIMAHTHEGDRNYYIDQLCTLGVSAALGVVCIVLYLRGVLGFLADMFHPAVLVGGVALILVALVRGVTLFVSVRQEASGHTHHEHGHEHHHHEHHHHHGEEACDHEHGHHHHEHDHHH